MAARFEVTAGALDDIEGIWGFIASDSYKAANDVESAIFRAFEAIAKHPNMGVKKANLTSANVRFMPVSRYPNYIILYTPETRPVRILAVIHGKRGVETVVRRLGHA